MIVAAGHKAAARRNNIDEGPAVNGNLQHSSVKGVFQIVVIPESQLRRTGADRDGWRVEELVADCRRVINKRMVGRRVRA